MQDFQSFDEEPLDLNLFISVCTPWEHVYESSPIPSSLKGDIIVPFFSQFLQIVVQMNCMILAVKNPRKFCLTSQSASA